MTTNTPLDWNIEPELSADEFVDVLRRSTLDERHFVDKLETIEGQPRWGKGIEIRKWNN